MALELRSHRQMSLDTGSGSCEFSLGFRYVCAGEELVRRGPSSSQPHLLRMGSRSGCRAWGCIRDPR